MSNSFFYAILIAFPVALTIIFITTSKVDWQKSSCRFNIKKAIDCLVYSFTFVFFTYTYYMSVELGLPHQAIFIPALECILMSFYHLWIFTKQFIVFSNSPFPLNKNVFPMILISLWVGVIMALSSINYAIYAIWPSFYEVPAGLTLWETAFEFIYYTFTLSITYSGSSIIVAHVATKSFQMIEICYCYAIIGSVIVQLIDSVKGNSTAKE